MKAKRNRAKVSRPHVNEACGEIAKSCDPNEPIYSQTEVNQMRQAMEHKPTVYDEIVDLNNTIARQKQEMEYASARLDGEQNTYHDLCSKRTALIEKLRQEMRSSRPM